MDGIDLTAFEMVVQYGFAGFALVLLGVVIWLIKRFLATEEKMIKAVSELTTAIKDNDNTNHRVLQKVEDLNNLIQRRPCIAKRG